MARCDIPWEDDYWERVREEREMPHWFDDEEVRESGTLFIDDEIEELEEHAGCAMGSLYEADLIEIVEGHTGRKVTDAKWNESYLGIEYHYEMKSEYF